MKILKKMTLIQRIILGMCLGILLGLIVPNFSFIGILGELFVGALKAIAPLLVFMIVLSSIGKHKNGEKTHLKSIFILYLLGTFLAAVFAVFASYLFPIKVPLSNAPASHEKTKSVLAFLKPMILDIVQNPLKAIIEGHYLSILFWSTLMGVSARHIKKETKEIIHDFSGIMQSIIKTIIACAPLGILGLVFNSVSKIGIAALGQYLKLMALLGGTMLFVALVIYPLMIFIMLRKNPYPLTFFCLKESGVPAFFTRSSAANIPINLELAKQLGLNETSYSISIPLGSTINMGGAAITISIMSLTAAHTLNLNIHLLTAILLCIVSTLAACGASGIAGGSLLLIPLACSLFGIQNDIAMQMVGVGFIINVLQDSIETMLNSSSDLLFTATAEYAKTDKKISNLKLKTIEKSIYENKN
ncbi:MAG: serine/threonine transporter SstT [Streptococcaceae bacterium]|jgi:serine/threonine transporter|nr:serine/threonine transporter SstT [Streptococcaceae bacterium]